MDKSYVEKRQELDQACRDALLYPLMVLALACVEIVVLVATQTTLFR